MLNPNVMQRAARARCSPAIQGAPSPEPPAAERGIVGRVFTNGAPGCDGLFARSTGQAAMRQGGSLRSPHSVQGQAWFRCVAGVVQVWFRRGSGVAQERFKYGSGVVRV